MAWYLLNLNQAKIAADRRARLHRIIKDGNNFRMLDACNPGDQIRGNVVGLFLFEKDSEEEALEYSRKIVKEILGEEHDVRRCDRCLDIE